MFSSLNHEVSKKCMILIDRRKTKMWVVALCVIALVVVKLSQWYYKWANPKCNGKLPPGSMGFPIIGETLEFFKPHGLHEISPFIKTRLSRYGALFRTNILGNKTIVSLDPEVNFEILRQENKSFVLYTPGVFTKASGEDHLFFKQGRLHKYIRQLTLQFIGPEGLKRKIIHDMDRATRQHLELKATECIFDLKDVAATLIMEILTPLMISDIELETKTRLMNSCKAFSMAFFGSFLSLSVWKAFYKSLAVRKDAQKMLKDMFKRRKATKHNYGDVLDKMLGELEKENSIMNEDAAILQIFGLLFIAQQSTSSAIGLAVKFISESPKVLEELKREHEMILRNRACEESSVTWEEYRSKMTFTHMVINESLRLGSISPAMFKRAVEDVEIKGYTIPADWIVLVFSTATHYDPQIYENPCLFNPWRWEGKELLTGSRNFMAFGGGARLCAGAEFARLQIALFLHHLVSKYNFSTVEEGCIVRTPLPSFTKKMLIRISKSCE